MEWLNAGVPVSQNPRVDLLARLADGGLLHLELQTANDPEFPRRAAEYDFGQYRQFDEDVEQIASYMGRATMTMGAIWVTPAVEFRYRLLDMRELDG